MRKKNRRQIARTARAPHQSPAAAAVPSSSAVTIIYAIAAVFTVLGINKLIEFEFNRNGKNALLSIETISAIDLFIFGIVVAAVLREELAAAYLLWKRPGTSRLSVSHAFQHSLYAGGALAVTVLLVLVLTSVIPR